MSTIQYCSFVAVFSRSDLHCRTLLTGLGLKIRVLEFRHFIDLGSQIKIEDPLLPQLHHDFAQNIGIFLGKKLEQWLLSFFVSKSEFL